MLSALLATVLVFASVGLLLYLTGLLFNAASLPLGGLLERQRFARYVARARRCDALMQQGEIDRGLQQLRAAFYLYAVSNRSLASSVANHHTALLSRLIAITSDLQGGTVRLLSLAKTDRLLTERSELQRRYFAAKQGPRSDRLRELQRQLLANSRELDAALQQLVAEVRAARQPARYH
ncbi:MAG TPA: hypothetical protein VN812_12975 [Candidatus Acidoferrales bacterium]|nr:hypothetical protein [Candidatus Acidoferrales bacterium]